MGLTGALKKVAEEACLMCKKRYDAHSKKQFIRCLFTANQNLYKAYISLEKLEQMEKPIEEIGADGGGEKENKA